MLTLGFFARGPWPLDCKITNIGASKCIMAYLIEGPLVSGQIHPYFGGLVKGLDISSVHWTLDHEAQMWDLRGPLSLKGVQMASVQGSSARRSTNVLWHMWLRGLLSIFGILSRGFKCLQKLSFVKKIHTRPISLTQLESELARTIDFTKIIDTFANIKARKVPLNV